VQPGEDRNKLQNLMKVAVRQICDYANGKNITVFMEDFDDIIAPFASMHELLAFMQDVPGLSCAFDTGNFLYCEEDVEEALKLLLPYIKHVHLKDRSLEVKAGESPKLTVKGRKLYSAAVGTGCIPMDKICHKLLENGYDKTFAVEHFGSQNQLEDMIKSAEWVKNHCVSI
jgi:sugar phosphate isomerase/epimerase